VRHFEPLLLNFLAGGRKSDLKEGFFLSDDGG